MRTWGKHLIIDAAGGDLTATKDPVTLNNFIKQLVHDIDMVAYGEPQIVHFADDVTHLAGWTVIQLIETSNITIHFIDLNGDFYFDLFSCKDFDETVVLSLIEEYFKPANIRKTILDRQA